MSGNEANQVVDLTSEELIEINDDEQDREAIDLTGTKIPQRESKPGILLALRRRFAPPQRQGHLKALGDR